MAASLWAAMPMTSGCGTSEEFDEALNQLVEDLEDAEDLEDIDEAFDDFNEDAFDD